MTFNEVMEEYRGAIFESFYSYEVLLANIEILKRDGIIFDSEFSKTYLGKRLAVEFKEKYEKDDWYQQTVRDAIFDNELLIKDSKERDSALIEFDSNITKQSNYIAETWPKELEEWHAKQREENERIN